MIASHPAEWKSLVECLRDPLKPKVSGSVSSGCDFRYVCEVCASKGCHAAFPTSKALLAHARIKHGTRSFVRNFIGSDNKCPVCQNVFSTRLRAIAHLSEKRKRGKRTISCHDLVLEGLATPLNPTVVASHDNEDRKLRKTARLMGHAQPLALYVAKRRFPQFESDVSPLCGDSKTEAPPQPSKRRRLRSKTTVHRQ